MVYTRKIASQMMNWNSAPTKLLLGLVRLNCLCCFLKKDYYFIYWLVFIICRFLARNPTSQFAPFLLGEGGGGCKNGRVGKDDAKRICV